MGRSCTSFCSSYCCPSKLVRLEKQQLKRIHLLELFQLLTGKKYSKHILIFDVKELSIINSDVVVSPFSPGWFSKEQLGPHIPLALSQSMTIELACCFPNRTYFSLQDSHKNSETKFIRISFKSAPLQGLVRRIWGFFSWVFVKQINHHPFFPSGTMTTLATSILRVISLIFWTLFQRAETKTDSTSRQHALWFKLQNNWDPVHTQHPSLCMHVAHMCTH